MGTIRHFLKRFRQTFTQVDTVHSYLTNDLKSPKILTGQVMARLNEQKQSIKNLDEVEFQVFSQWGDDGILQYMIGKIDIPHKTFIEFGVENYRESNSRFLLVNNKWHGLVIDGSPANTSFIENDVIHWATHLHVLNSFITRDNINKLITDSFLSKGYDKEIGMLSVDIDGNDYWVWEAIAVVNPVIVVAEYNGLFGYNTKWTLPYKQDFVRARNGLPQTYYGVSINALDHLARQKGYVFVGCNSNGNNAYFIRKDKMVDAIPECEISAGYVVPFFREMAVNGQRLSGRDRISVLEGLDVVDLDSNSIIKINSSLIRY